MSMTTEMRKLRNDIERFKTQVEVELKEKVQGVATAALQQLVHLSPVDTGSYVLSHRVSINTIDRSFSIFLPSPEQLLRARTAKTRALVYEGQKIAAAGPFDTVYISNSVPHALQVEVLGWEKTPPYQVYTLAALYLKLLLPTLGSAQAVPDVIEEF